MNPRKHRQVPAGQQTFAEINGIAKIHTLTDNQRRILALVACKLTQAEIADKLKFSPSYICQVIKKLQTFNLIKKLETQRTQQGLRDYNNFYELSPELKGQIRKEIQQPFTPVRVHYIIRKFRIVGQSGPASKDKRASYSKSWYPRGGERQKYWYPGKAGLPSVTIDVHPKTIVAYVDKGQTIPARSMEEAEQMGWYALYQAKDQFIEQQQLFGVSFEIENVGQQIGSAHGGLVIREESPFAKEQPVTPGIWIDKSAKELQKGLAEVEGFTNGPHLTRVEKGLFAIEALEETMPDRIKAALPEVVLPEAIATFEKQFGPLTKEIHSVMAHIESGQSVDSRLNQLILMFGDMLTQQHDIIEMLSKRGINIENK